MSETRVEITGNIVVHHPVKKPEAEYQLWFEEDWDTIRARAILQLMGPIRNPFVFIDGQAA